MRKYITIQGDKWDIIAYKVYGDVKYMTALMNANYEHCTTVIFEGNVELKVPELNVEKQSEGLPIWKQGV